MSWVLVFVACIHAPAHPEIGVFAPGPPPSVVIRDVRVFTATEAGVLEHQDVRLSGGRIDRIGPTGGAWVGEVTVPGAGRTLMPGLVDLHVHLALYAGPPWFLAVPEPGHTARSFVDAGITTVLDVGGDPRTITKLQRKMAAGRWVGPRIGFAGQGLTCPRSSARSIASRTPASASSS